MSEQKHIKESTATYSIIEASARRLFPNLSLDQALVELLLEKAQKHLIKYQAAMRQFEAKYPQGFDGLRSQVSQADTSAEMEQDYFDWELAVTGAADMVEELGHLKDLSG